MSWGLVAIGSAGLALGYLASKEAKGLREDAQGAQDKANAFEAQRYSDWQDTYGGLESNLADYYSNLSPERYAAQGLDAFETEYTQGLSNLRENLAQRGIDPSSGIAASLTAQSEINAAETKAQIRSNAVDIVDAKQLNFLQLGLGQNPANNYSNSLQNTANMLTNQAAEASQAAGDLIGGGITNIGGGIVNASNNQSSSSKITGGSVKPYQSDLVPNPPMNAPIPNLDRS